MERINLEEIVGNDSEISSPSRRNFLKNVGVGLVGASILGSSVVNAAGKYDNMEVLKHYLPPGILNCRDRAIRILYAQEISGLWNNDFPQVAARMSSKYGGYFDSVIVSPSSRHLEPAWYMLREQINYKKGYTGRGGDIVLSDGPFSHVSQMLAFNEGIEHWFKVHKLDWKSAEPKTEDRLFHSISYAAYDDEQTAEERADEYLNSDIDGKTEIAIDIRDRFREMGSGNKESKDPRDPFNRRLVSAWAGFMLTLHHQMLKNRDLIDSTYNHLEKDTRQIMGFKIRGPPHYRYV